MLTSVRFLSFQLDLQMEFERLSPTEAVKGMDVAIPELVMIINYHLHNWVHIHP